MVGVMEARESVKHAVFQNATRMGIDSKHPKVRNFTVKFKTFPKRENHVQARSYVIPYVTEAIYKKYPEQDYPSKDVDWFDIEIVFNNAFVKENLSKIGTPAMANLIVHELSHAKHGIQNYRSFFREDNTHSSKIFKEMVKKYAYGDDAIKKEWLTGTSPSTKVPPRYFLVPHSTEYVMILCPKCGYIDTGRYEKRQSVTCDFCGYNKPIKVIVSANVFTNFTYQSQRLTDNNYHKKMINLILGYMLQSAPPKVKPGLQRHIDDKEFMKAKVYDRSGDVTKMKRKGYGK
jgi:hypothetical protein